MIFAWNSKSCYFLNFDELDAYLEENFLFSLIVRLNMIQIFCLEENFKHGRKNMKNISKEIRK